MGFSLVALLTYGGLFAWLTAGPAILIHGLHVSPSHFGMLIILTGLSTGASGIAGGKTVKDDITITNVTARFVANVICRGIFTCSHKLSWHSYY